MQRHETPGGPQSLGSLVCPLPLRQHLRCLAGFIVIHKQGTATVTVTATASVTFGISRFAESDCRDGRKQTCSSCETRAKIFSKVRHIDGLPAEDIQTPKSKWYWVIACTFLHTELGGSNPHLSSAFSSFSTPLPCLLTSIPRVMQLPDLLRNNQSNPKPVHRLTSPIRPITPAR